MTEQAWIDSDGLVWNRWPDVACVECPRCAFTFDEVHTSKVDGAAGYTCPACAEDDLQAELTVLRARAEQAEAQRLRLAQALRILRDTTRGFAANVADRALAEAGIVDPPEEDHL